MLQELKIVTLYELYKFDNFEGTTVYRSFHETQDEVNQKHAELTGFEPGFIRVAAFGILMDPDTQYCVTKTRGIKCTIDNKIVFCPEYALSEIAIPLSSPGG